jgi:hypothetical protein
MPDRQAQRREHGPQDEHLLDLVIHSPPSLEAVELLR